MTALLLFFALLFIIVGGLMLLVAMFRMSIWWGIGGLLFAPLQIVFIFKYWHESRMAIIVQISGLLLMLLAVLAGKDTFDEKYRQQLNRYLQQVAPEQMRQLNEMQSTGALPDFGLDTGPGDAAPAGAAGDQKSAAEKTAGQDQPVAPPVSGNQKVIHKCVDAKGRVAYTEQPCEGAQEKKVITIKESDNRRAAPENSGGSVLDTVREMVTPDAEPAR